MQLAEVGGGSLPVVLVANKVGKCFLLFHTVGDRLHVTAQSGPGILVFHGVCLRCPFVGKGKHRERGVILHLKVRVADIQQGFFTVWKETAVFLSCNYAI